MFVTEGQIHVEDKTWWKTIVKVECQIHIEGKIQNNGRRPYLWSKARLKIMVKDQTLGLRPNPKTIKLKVEDHTHCRRPPYP
ncbi:hypothetical protein GBA52_012444 [Prunus armeniaca]|nr:hypothetical protein GBA52_012444 [Prunus armeniaca]